MKILGTKFFHHDCAAFLLDFDRRDVFAMSAERVTRIKHDNADIEPILAAYPEVFSGVTEVCHSFRDADRGRKPFVDLCVSNIHAVQALKSYRRAAGVKYLKDMSAPKFEKLKRLLRSSFRQPRDVVRGLFHYLAMRTADDRDETKNQAAVRAYMESVIARQGLGRPTITFFEHHLCHAAASYYFSPFELGSDVLCLTLDGAGDGFFSKAYLSDGCDFDLVGASPNVTLPSGLTMTSIGLVYERFTAAMGLTPGSDEGKVEARAAYGRPDPQLSRLLREMSRVNGTSIEFDLEACAKIYDLAFLKSERLRMGDEAFCASVQTWLEDVVVDYLNVLAARHPQVRQLALSGGVAANIIMSLAIFERTPFTHIYVLPFMADDGTAAGAAILRALDLGWDVSWLKDRQMPYFGDRHDRAAVATAIERFRDRITIDDLGDGWIAAAVADLVDRKVIGLFQGRMEFGPRALGNRSIIANALDPEARDRINAKVKRRPWYQPFCPSVLAEDRERLFEQSFMHKHMAIAFRLKPEFRQVLSSAVHVDGTGRPQFVEENDNPAYFRLLSEFKKVTGYGILINTSFNLHGRTIVRSPEDAIVDFIDCDIDRLYIGNYRVTRLQ